MKTRGHLLLRLLPLALVLAMAGCQTARPRTFLPRQGDEIVVAGQLYRTGTRVITWMDPGGYDAYRVERRFAPLEESEWDKSRAAVEHLTTPNRYSMRKVALTPAEMERMRGGGWDLATLQKHVDQLVLHYDVSGFSRACFKTLHDHRGLSAHFMLDLDGTIYQTLDLKERARHATIANDRSIGIEIANIGAYPPGEAAPLDEWYQAGPEGPPAVRVPARFGDPAFHTPGFTPRPARAERVRGVIQGQELVQHDLTPQQYEALIKLTAALCQVFPKIKPDYPRDAEGRLVTKKLPDEELQKFQGVIGHYHIQTNKADPGPAFQWERVINGARRLLGLYPLPPAKE